MNVTEYRNAIIKHGIPVELPSDLHIKELCEAVFSSKPCDTTRRVIEHGRFTSRDVDDRGVKIQKNFVIVPPDKDVIRDLVMDLMPIARKGTKGGYAALEVIKALRPTGREPKIKVPVSRLLYDPTNGAYGDIAENHGGYDLDLNALSNKVVKVRPFKDAGESWVAVSGDQIGNKAYYTISAAMAIPESEWEGPNPDDWHLYYGRPVLIDGKKHILGPLATFVPNREPPKAKIKRRRHAVAAGRRRNEGDEIPESGWVY